MECLHTKDAVNRQWQRGSYALLGGCSWIEAADSDGRWQRGIRLRSRPRLKWLVGLSPAKKMISWVRNAYMRMMLALAYSRLVRAGYKRGNRPVVRFKSCPRKEPVAVVLQQPVFPPFSVNC
ncbi:hypothetical protein SAY87_027826 [Trapa incisa]|uniref:Uncharacterized protein n=1 Tax=Trapa incisa TaxID=236973 RepID=A0AAN7PIY3_9MYRT|nr:hypothetical protein SAY87_027826 [Trapa incisa]